MYKVLHCLAQILFYKRFQLNQENQKEKAVFQIRHKFEKRTEMPSVCLLAGQGQIVGIRCAHGRRGGKGRG